MKKTTLFVWAVCICTLALSACTQQQEAKEIRPMEIWPDNAGVHVNAHGGGILYHEGTYYWYGENKSDTTSSAMVGIMCYSSPNLTDWKNEGAVLPVVTNDTTSEITQGCIMERPKVIYNEKTGKFVMWFHLELKGKGYAAARSAVAVADRPTGPFKYLRSGRINPGKLPFDMTDEQRAVLDTLDAGDLTIEGRSLIGLTPKERTLYRKEEAGFVFQFYNLIPDLTVEENIEVVSDISESPLDLSEVLGALELEPYRRRFPRELEGGHCKSHDQKPQAATLR